MKRYYLLEPCRVIEGKEKKLCEFIISLSEEGANVEYWGPRLDYVRRREIGVGETEARKKQKERLERTTDSRLREAVEKAADKALKHGCAP